jgi:hypothetical protein
MFVCIAESREKGYIFAITSAGIMYSVVKACATGLMPTCSCDVTNAANHVTQHGGRKEPDFLWGGCSHDISFGDRFTRDFVDDSENPLTDIGAMNIWNNGAGRQVVKLTLWKELYISFPVIMNFWLRLQRNWRLT